MLHPRSSIKKCSMPQKNASMSEWHCWMELISKKQLISHQFMHNKRTFLQGPTCHRVSQVLKKLDIRTYKGLWNAKIFQLYLATHRMQPSWKLEMLSISTGNALKKEMYYDPTIDRQQGRQAISSTLKVSCMWISDNQFKQVTTKPSSQVNYAETTQSNRR